MNFEPQKLPVVIKYAVIAVLLLIIGIIIFLWISLLPRVTATPTPEVPAETPAEVLPTATPTLPAPTLAPVSAERVTVKPEESNKYLANPGIGWQFDHGDMESSSVLPETVAYYRQEFNWKELNPAEGVFNWGILDQYISLAKSEGKDASIRVVTMLGEDFGPHQVPGWVLKKGAVILGYGAPDYANCVYQEEWSIFVQALIDRYDGSPNIAFFDISGYGNFNEWGWDDNQTEWDETWQNNYTEGNTDPTGLSTMDGQARRRLSDMFTGGSNPSHQCRAADSSIKTISYAYKGFTKTQLIMPYAGIPASTEYVYSRHRDVGFRYDCMGRDARINGLDSVLASLWRSAPIVYEFCGWKPLVLAKAKQLLDDTHGSLVHNNESPFTQEELDDLLYLAGYRYFLDSAVYNREVRAGTPLPLDMTWKNTGNAPYYPKMGHIFELHAALADSKGQIVLDKAIQEDISRWMPAEIAGDDAPAIKVKALLDIPADLAPGDYIPHVYIMDLKTGLAISLSMNGMDSRNWYALKAVTIK
jgi:hypothetical protein